MSVHEIVIVVLIIFPIIRPRQRPMKKTKTKPEQYAYWTDAQKQNHKSQLSEFHLKASIINWQF